MEELEKTNPYSTASHNEELDFIYNQDSDDFDEIIFKGNKDLAHELKLFFRLLRKKFSCIVKDKIQKNFTNIIYLTLDCPPFTPNSFRGDSPIEYITELRKQYPYNDIRILIPIINVDEESQISKKITVEIDGKPRVLEKTSITFDFFLQNRVQVATVYKFPKTQANIQVYGVFSPVYSRVKNISELSKLHYLAPLSLIHI